ncbi:MAG: Maf family protein [Desulforhopalus sp.]
MYGSRETIILASASPRRKLYLEEMGLDFSVQKSFVEERREEGEGSDEFVCRVAGEKANDVSSRSPDSWVISGDTVVCLDNEILGKPEDEQQALETLMKLCGRQHEVKTAFCVAHRRRGIAINQLVTTRVHFAPFTEAVAKAYVATGEPLDKAGAYGIQGKGASLVMGIEGSYTNVVGLPLYELIDVLLKNKVIFAL